MAIDPKALARWRNAKGRREKFNIYFNEIRPAITVALKQQLEYKKEGGVIGTYNTLVVIVGHDVVPGLILANALLPSRLFVLYTERNAHQVHTMFVPSLDAAIREKSTLEFLELSANNHDENYRKIYALLQKLAFGEKILCDITGGKKITAAHLALAAEHFGCAISYIDATGYLENSAIPEPGTEVLYIHLPEGKGVLEIEPWPRRSILINYAKKYGDILFTYSDCGKFFRFEKSGLTGSILEETSHAIGIEYTKIDDAILKSQSCQRELDELATILRTMIIPNGLDTMLRISKGETLDLIIDPELAGIPWEIALVREYGAALPVVRILNRDFDNTALYKKKEYSGILFLVGSQEGIDRFDRIIERLRLFLERIHVAIRIVAADDVGVVVRELSRQRYVAIAYFGHSVFDENPALCGWVCQNGEIFGCDKLDVLCHNPPTMVISISCHSARAKPFSRHSFAYSALMAGAKSYVGTRWFLEIDRSVVFLSELFRSMLVKKRSPRESFEHALKALVKKYGVDDTAPYNYVLYG